MSIRIENLRGESRLIISVPIASEFQLLFSKAAEYLEGASLYFVYTLIRLIPFPANSIFADPCSQASTFLLI